MKPTYTVADYTVYIPNRVNGEPEAGSTIQIPVRIDPDTGDQMMTNIGCKLIEAERARLISKQQPKPAGKKQYVVKLVVEEVDASVPRDGSLELSTFTSRKDAQEWVQSFLEASVTG